MRSATWNRQAVITRIHRDRIADRVLLATRDVLRRVLGAHFVGRCKTTRHTMSGTTTGRLDQQSQPRGWWSQPSCREWCFEPVYSS